MAASATTFSYTFLVFPCDDYQFERLTIPNIIVDRILGPSSQRTDTNVFSHPFTRGHNGGDVLIPPWSVFASKNGITLLDSGTTLSLLTEEAYDPFMLDRRQYLLWSALILTATPPSEEGLNTGTSCISLILLVEIAKLYTPASLNVSLANILVEVFDGVHFIEEQLNVANDGNATKKSTYAKVIMKYGLISTLVYRKRSLNYDRRFPNKEYKIEPHTEVGIIGDIVLKDITNLDGQIMTVTIRQIQDIKV